MLVLSRLIDQRIVIGDDIIITVCDVVGDKVRLGIEAPGLRVLREELIGKPRKTNGENMEADL